MAWQTVSKKFRVAHLDYTYKSMPDKFDGMPAKVKWPNPTIEGFEKES